VARAVFPRSYSEPQLNAIWYFLPAVVGNTCEIELPKPLPPMLRSQA